MLRRPVIYSARRSRLARAVLLLFSVISTGAAQDAKDSGITRQQADDILKELREIRQLLQRTTKPAIPTPMANLPQTGKLRLNGGGSLGSQDAPLVIVEFTDYECPYCRQFLGTILPEIRKKYIDTGRVRFVVRDMPGHAESMHAAEAARCAGDQGQFWPMHDALFSELGKPEAKDFVKRAEALKLDVGAFRNCLEGGKHKLEIQNDMQVATSLQIMGTPSFVVGRLKGEEVDGAIIVGAQPFNVFEAKIKAAEADP
jgi:protein-disulfide isomerase